MPAPFEPIEIYARSVNTIPEQDPTMAPLVVN